MGHAFTNISATTAAVANRIVTSANMKVGDYTIANASPVWQGGALITVTHTQVGGVTDTLGTIVLEGLDLAGRPITETITPADGTVATGTLVFRSVTKVTGVGWVINTGNDTITVGVAAGSVPLGGPGTLHSVVLNNSVAAAVVVSDGTRTLATIPASAAAGTEYIYDVAIGSYLKVATTSTNDVTVIHSGTLPSSYAMA
jgi:hypothetical protein